MGRKKKEAVEPEIVSIAPTAGKAAIAQMQQSAQLQATQKDIQEFLPPLQEARQKLTSLIVEVLMSEDEKTINALKKWIATHLKDATAALSTLNNVTGTIVKPQQVTTSTRKRRQYKWKSNDGKETFEEEVEITGETSET